MTIQLFFLFLSLFSPRVEADTVKPQLNFCEPQIFALLQKNHSRGQWRQIPSATENVLFYRSPSKNIGSWIELGIGSKSVEVKITSATGSYDSYTFTNKKCQKPAISHAKLKNTFSVTGLNDSELKQLIQRPERTLIYIWNPAADLSLTHFKFYQAEAKKRNLKIITLLAPLANKDWAQKVAHKYNLITREHSSFELYFRGADDHYPSAFVVGENKISPRLMGGLESDNVNRFFNNLFEAKHDVY
ncbi:MAG: hypothetical protein ACLGGX_11605 [Bdellovibrionia bacterium]